VADVPVVLQEAWRILRAGGRLVVVDLVAHEREDFRQEMGQHRLGFAPSEIEDELARVGFVGVDVKPLPPEPDAKGPALFLAVAERREQVRES